METKIVTIDLDARSYDIFIGSALLYRIQDFIPQDVNNRSFFIVTDKHVEQYAANVRSQIMQGGARICELMVVPSGVIWRKKQL